MARSAALYGPAYRDENHLASRWFIGRLLCWMAESIQTLEFVVNLAPTFFRALSRLPLTHKTSDNLVEMQDVFHERMHDH